MHLTQYTDYAIKVLIYLGASSDQYHTVRVIAREPRDSMIGRAARHMEPATTRVECLDPRWPDTSQHTRDNSCYPQQPSRRLDDNIRT